MPSEKTIKLLQFLDANPNKAASVNWDKVVAESPDLNMEKVRARYKVDAQVSFSPVAAATGIPQSAWDIINQAKEKYYAPKEPTSIGNVAGNILKGLARVADPTAQVDVPAQMIQHPIEAIKGVGRQWGNIMAAGSTMPPIQKMGATEIGTDPVGHLMAASLPFGVSGGLIGTFNKLGGLKYRVLGSSVRKVAGLEGVEGDFVMVGKRPAIVYHRSPDKGWIRYSTKEPAMPNLAAELEKATEPYNPNRKALRPYVPFIPSSERPNKQGSFSPEGAISKWEQEMSREPSGPLSQSERWHLKEWKPELGSEPVLGKEPVLGRGPALGGALKIPRLIFSESRNLVKTPLGKKLISEMEDVRADRYTIAGEFMTRYRKAPKLGDVATPEIRSILDDIATEAEKAGVKVTDAKGQARLFQRRKDYIPRMLRADVREALFDDIVNAERKLNEYAKTTHGFVDKAHLARLKAQLGEPYVIGKQVVRLQPRTVQAINHIMNKNDVGFEKAYDILTRYIDSEKYNPFANLEKSRVLDLPSEFYESNLKKVIPEYILGASRAIAEVRAWGPKREAMTSRLMELNTEHKGDFGIVNQMYELSTGEFEKSHQLSPAMKKFTNAFMNYEVASKIGLGTAVIPNISQTLISTATKAPWHKVISGGFKYATQADFRNAVRMSGSTVQEAIQMLTGLEYEGVLRHTTKGLMLPFSAINRANKALAAATARDWIPDLHRFANEGGLRQAHAQRQLKSLGVDWTKPLDEPTLRKGMFRFASDTQLQRDIFKEPLWMNRPSTRVFALFKRFGYRQFNMVREEVFNEMIKGNPMPTLRLVVGGTIGGEFVQGAKGLMKKWLSGEPYDEKDRTLARRIADDLAAVGALGGASDISRIWGETPEAQRRSLAKNIAFGVSPVLGTEAYKALFETLPNIVGSKEPLKATSKAIAKQFPIARMSLADEEKKFNRGGRGGRGSGRGGR